MSLFKRLDDATIKRFTKFFAVANRLLDALAAGIIS
jgi:hypothetical protein